MFGTEVVVTKMKHTFCVQTVPVSVIVLETLKTRSQKCTRIVTVCINFLNCLEYLSSNLGGEKY
jgi:hypothetical protein